ncbi:MAG TPA: hypothetical protein PK200_14120, partial [Spirochaetota bacterium]|nr:hypothetical protein [Spirochaetota bacterium]
CIDERGQYTNKGGDIYIGRPSCFPQKNMMSYSDIMLWEVTISYRKKLLYIVAGSICYTAKSSIE